MGLATPSVISQSLFVLQKGLTTEDASMQNELVIIQHSFLLHHKASDHLAIYLRIIDVDKEHSKK